MANETQRGFAEVEGARLYYEVAGDGDPVALIHGFGLDARMWDAQSDALADRYRVIRYDARGFGRSSLPTTEPFSHAGDLRALLRELGATPAHVVGLSMGGRIALNLALLDPTAVRSLTLVDAALDGFDWSEAWSASFDAIEECAARDGVERAKHMWLEHELFAPARERPQCSAALARMVGDWSGWQLHNETPVTPMDPPAAARLAEVRAPCLVVVGERDLPDFLAIAGLLAAGIPAAQKIVLRGAGHMCTMEAPSEFNGVLAAFLNAQPSPV